MNDIVGGSRQGPRPDLENFRIYGDFEFSDSSGEVGTVVAFLTCGCRLKTCEDPGRIGLTPDEARSLAVSL